MAEMDPLTKQREVLIPYRMKAISILNLALGLRDEPREMKIYLDGKLVVEGLSTAFTNPAIESGILHGRALLEFLGLRLKNNTIDKLTTVERRQSGDIGIEGFGLPKVTVDMALSKYSGPSDEAERALATIIALANKNLAHNTALLPENDDQNRLIEIACREIPSLVISYFYTPLGCKSPSYELVTRPRDS